jgi:hypothetical protein
VVLPDSKGREAPDPEPGVSRRKTGFFFLWGEDHFSPYPGMGETAKNPWFDDRIF